MRKLGCILRERSARSLALLAVMGGIASLLAVTALRASASLQDVWYPNGTIKYFIQDDASTRDYSDVIQETMEYMTSHTPLDISEAASVDSANLTFAVYWGASDAFCDGGLTDGYWDSNHDDSNKKIRFDPTWAPDRTTVAHEFGHALGRPHEFQRDDRDDYVNLGACSDVDTWNYGKVSSAAYKLLDLWGPDQYWNLSPYDVDSVMNAGYTCVAPHWDSRYGPDYSYPNSSSDGSGNIANLLSIHDINGIYRMYADGLGSNDSGDRFGVAVSSGDYDDDGYEDVVVANLQTGNLWLEFYRGVEPDASEDVVGLKWVPWFKEMWYKKKATCAANCVSSDEEVVLTTGDFNGDGIDDLALGVPGYNDGSGIVSILFVNTSPGDSGKSDFERKFAPWGRQGIQYQIDIEPDSVGLVEPSASNYAALVHRHFGSALAAVRATAYEEKWYQNPYEDIMNGAPSFMSVVYDDLVIGAPGAVKVTSTTGRLGVTTETIDWSKMGAVMILKGSYAHSPKDFSIATHQTLWNPSTGGGDFGSAVAGVPGLCQPTGTESLSNITDFIAVGAPEYSSMAKVYVYGCATTGTSSQLTVPPLVASLSAAKQGYGSALAGFFVAETNKSYLVIGSPSELVNGTPVGKVYLKQVSKSGLLASVTTIYPGTYSGYDEFGSVLAVQQRPSDPDSSDARNGSRDMFIGIGMPGTHVGDVAGGKVVVWQPFNSDGSINTSKVYISPTNPDRTTTTRFGDSLAPVRTLTEEGGFITGAPEAITPDGVRAGQVSIIQNRGGAFTWTSYAADHIDLDQQTEGDKQPTNQ